MIDFGEHGCNDCSAKGHCSVEPLARYFGSRPEEEEFLSNCETMLNGDWMDALVTDALSSGEDIVKFAHLIAIATGYIMGKGEPAPLDIKPDNRRAIAAIIQGLGKKHTEN